MADNANVQSLTQAVQRYFDLCYDSDLSRFDRVLYPTAQLHGVVDGKMAMRSAQAFKDMAASNPSLKSRGVPRQEQVLLMDFASPTQAFVKVRVRWSKSVYIDYLTYHRIDGDWLITSKGFHIESTESSGEPR